MRNKGFTLVEVLVVSTIILILSSVAIVMVGRYQDRAKDVAIAAALSQVRKVAAMIYADDNSYANICQNDTLNDQDYKDLKAIEDDLVKRVGTAPKCKSAQAEFCVQIALLSSGYFCVDATGFSKEISGNYCTNSSKNCSAP